MQTDPVQWVNQHSQVIKDIDEVEAQVHSSNEMGVYVTAPNVFTDQFIQFVHTFTDKVWPRTSRPDASPPRRASRRRSAT